MAPITASNVADAGSTATDDTIFGVPKWALAAAAGGLVVAGVAYYVLSSSKPGKKKDGKKKGKKGSTKPASNASSTTSTPSKPTTAPKVTLKDVGAEEDNLPKDPSERAMAAKDKGNKYFKGGRYELAIKCYTEAIELCPEGKTDELAIYHQNRAAAYEQLENYSAVMNDCSMAIKLNPKYIKALERRARITRLQSKRLTDEDEIVEKLKSSLEDLSAACILEAFGNPDRMSVVDGVIKELGRAEAKLAFAKRQFHLASKHFVKQYLESFEADPVRKAAETFIPPEGQALSGFNRALNALKTGNYEEVMDACTEEIERSSSVNGLENGGHDSDDFVRNGAKLLRSTFNILCKKQKEAMADLSEIIADENCPANIKSNALIKRASLYIQLCSDPEKDPLLSFADFEEALKADPTNPDVYFHRGQVYLLTEQIEKAVQDFDKSVELNPTFPTAYVQKLYTDYRQAMQQNSQVMVQNVLNLFEKALDKYPDCIETYALYAQVLSDQQQFEKADSCYERAMKADPTNANILVHRGLIHLQWRGDVAKATDYIEQAIKLDDKCEFAYETLGTLEVQRGNLKRSIELFEKAIPLANTELEMAHLFGMLDAAKAQIIVTGRLGIQMPGPVL